MAPNIVTLRPRTSLEAMLATIPSLPRPVLSRLVQQMIDHMDTLDPDCDLEPEDDACIAGDDGCGLHFDGYGKPAWGSEHYATLPERPLYGVDQRSWPINLEEANRDFQAAQAGLVRKPGGGWTLPI